MDTAGSLAVSPYSNEKSLLPLRCGFQKPWKGLNPRSNFRKFMPAAPRSVLEESGKASEKACVAGEEEGARQRCMLSAGDKKS